MNATNKNVPTEPEPASDSEPCYMSETLDLIGGKWPVLVMGVLSRGTQRHSELRRAVDGISQRMLTLSLKGLEENGLVKRTLFPSVPPRVDYELTPLGHTLVGPLRALKEWTMMHREELQEARRAYAKRTA